jgi:hypothetical protein
MHFSYAEAIFCGGEVMALFRVQSICWETDGRSPDLPAEVVVECEDESDIADILSDTYGWLVNDFSLGTEIDDPHAEEGLGNEG